MITMNVSGNICADAIVRNVNGTDMITFAVASNRRYKTASGEIKEEVTYLPCQLWNRPEAAKLLFKGRAVNVVGYFNVKNYVSNDGVLKTFFSVRVTSFDVFGKGKLQEQQLGQTGQPTYQENETLPVENDPPAAAEIVEDLPF